MSFDATAWKKNFAKLKKFVSKLNELFCTIPLKNHFEKSFLCFDLYWLGIIIVLFCLNSIFLCITSVSSYQYF